MCPRQQAPPFEEQQWTAGLARQLCLSHTETSAHTLEQWAQLLLCSSDLIVTNMHSKKVVCDQLCFTWTDFTAFSFYFLRVFAGILFWTMNFLTFLFGDVAGAQHTLYDSKGPEIRMPRFTMWVCFAIWNTNYERREKEEKVQLEKVCLLATPLWIFIWFMHICLKQCLYT